MTKPLFIIASAELSTLSTKNNNRRTNMLYRALINLGIKFKACNGVYKGVSEDSVAFCIKDLSLLPKIKRLFLKEFNQESILLIKGNDGELLFQNGELSPIGTLKEVKSQPKTDAYTQMGNRYFIFE